MTIHLAVYLFSFLDRQILSVLLQPIKLEFRFTDTQLGLLGGMAFALFYSTLGIPIAWLADRLKSREGEVEDPCSKLQGISQM